ncbi:hypothetical protein EYF80_015575 [Liparis tanakae]|uniref:Uncharacterized protein n=1 Tax=Liparis tanakae TaxID=230148 RepID=A0A4Z2I8D6_9TELE|nr:hypothetical protein EYF80_015575 [Liparis tanakae]
MHSLRRQASYSHVCSDGNCGPNPLAARAACQVEVFTLNTKNFLVLNWCRDGSTERSAGRGRAAATSAARSSVPSAGAVG